LTDFDTYFITTLCAWSISNLSDFFTLSGSSITRGHCYKISFHHCRVSARLNFFSNRVIAVWNSLPETVVTAPTIDILKSLLMKLELPIV